MCDITLKMKVGKRFHQTKVSRNWFFAPFLTHVLWQSMVHSRKMIPIDTGVWHCINNYDIKYIIEIYVLVLIKLWTRWQIRGVYQNFCFKEIKTNLEHFHQHVWCVYRCEIIVKAECVKALGICKEWLNVLYTAYDKAGNIKWQLFCMMSSFFFQHPHIM